jgi:hypothetical protein
MSVKHVTATCFGTELTILRERNVPGLKPTASEKFYLQGSQSVVGSVVGISYV